MLPAHSRDACCAEEERLEARVASESPNGNEVSFLFKATCGLSCCVVCYPRGRFKFLEGLSVCCLLINLCTSLLFDAHSLSFPSLFFLDFVIWCIWHVTTAGVIIDII